jgi:hypothetical protein
MLLAGWAMAACSPSFSPLAGRGEALVIVRPDELIIGRTADEGRVWLLTAARSLILVDRRRTSTVRAQLTGIADDEPLWGLGRLSNGSLWTLLGYRSLAELDESGRLLAQVNLERPHVALFGWRGRLILQELSLEPKGPALVSTTPNDTDRRAFGALERHQLATRAETLANQLALCGQSEYDELPCWFSHDLRIHRVHWDGTSRLSVAAGLGLTEKPFDLRSATTPARPVRDAYIDGTGDLWLLTMAPEDGARGNASGASQLARYDAQGRLIGVMRLTEPARIILSARSEGVELLSVSGHLRTVRPS